MQKRIISFSLLLLLLFSSKTYAYVGDKVDEDKIETWTQFGYPNLSEEKLIPGGDTVGNAACGYFSLTSAALKEGTVNENYKPRDLINAVREKNLTNSWWGHIDFNRVEELDIGLKLPEIRSYENASRSQYDWYFSGNWETKQETIRKMWKDGYYIILCLQNYDTSGHYVFVDYVDENGRIRITDSAYRGTWLDEQYSGGFSYGILLESKNNRPSNLQYSVYGNFDENSTGFDKNITTKRGKIMRSSFGDWTFSEPKFEGEISVDVN